MQVWGGVVGVVLIQVPGGENIAHNQNVGDNDDKDDGADDDNDDDANV